MSDENGELEWAEQRRQAENEARESERDSRPMASMGGIFGAGDAAVAAEAIGFYREHRPDKDRIAKVLDRLPPSFAIWLLKMRVNLLLGGGAESPAEEPETIQREGVIRYEPLRPPMFATACKPCNGWTWEFYRNTVTGFEHVEPCAYCSSFKTRRWWIDYLAASKKRGGKAATKAEKWEDD